MKINLDELESYIYEAVAEESADIFDGPARRSMEDQFSVEVARELVSLIRRQEKELAEARAERREESSGLRVAIVDERAAAPAPVAASDELETMLAVFDIGLGFALCHSDFGATRAAIKRLQDDFTKIRAALAAVPAAAPVVQPEPSTKNATRQALHVMNMAHKYGWREGGDEGAFEFITRIAYEIGWDDCAERKPRDGKRAATPSSTAEAKDAARVKAVHVAVSALYFDDSSDFKWSLGTVIRHLDMELASEFFASPKAAYDKSSAALAAIASSAAEVKGGVNA